MDSAFLNQQRISTIFNVACDCNDPHIGYRCIKIGLIDGPGNPRWMVDMAVDVMKKLIEAGSGSTSIAWPATAEVFTFSPAPSPTSRGIVIRKSGIKSLLYVRK